MKQNLEFTPIDLRTWCRGEVFYYFSKMAPTGYSLTVELDVTNLRKTLKAKGYKFFPAHADFRLRHSGGRKTMPRKEQQRKDNSNTKKQANANFSSIHILIIGIFYRFF